MNTTVLRDRPQWFILGAVALAAVVGGALRILLPPTPTAQQSDAETSAQVAATESGDPTVAATDSELFQSPMINLSAELRKAATPSELLNSTTTNDRLAVIPTGRLDPFAPITRPIAPATPAPATAPAAVDPTIAALPTAPVAITPDLPPVPTVGTAPPPLPSIPVANNPVAIPSLPSALPQLNAAPQHPVDAIKLMGVVHVGDRVGVIVREGTGKTSRHLFEGDLLAGGQIRVKAIDLSAQEPLVILEYQGQEYPRMVG
jgi:hypothetical protein